MARIPADELERLKKEVPLTRLAEAKGVELKRHGADLIGCCPFHEDKTPSLVITPDKNLWHCLGACQAGGSVVDWVMKAEGVSFRHAVELLREGMPTSVPASPAPAARPPVKHATVKKLSAPVPMDADDQEVLQRVVAYYHEQLKQSPEAMSYLTKRGLKSSQMVEHFKLGFANRTLGYRLPERNRQAGEKIRGQLIRLGVLRESGHEHFTGSVVIPILDEAGQVLGMYGRKITPGLKLGTPLHMYLPGPHRGVFNAAALKGQETIILCEALIDALTFWCAGFRNVTASYGVSGFTEEHLTAFRESGAKRVLIAYDRDDAGDAAARPLAERLMAEGLECQRVLFPKGMDANEYALKVQPAQKSLGLALSQAAWMGKPSPLAAQPSPAVRLEAKPDPAAAKEEKPLASIAELETVQAPIAPLPARPASAPEAPAIAAIQAPAASLAEPAMLVPSPEPLPAAQVSEEEVVIVLGERRYRVRGLTRNLTPEQMRVNLLCTRGAGFHVDTLDMYSAKARAAYLKQAATEIGVPEEVVKRDLGRVLLKLEELQDAQLKKAGQPARKAAAEMSEPERALALELLRDPKLLDRILSDFERTGVVGEEENKLVGYLATISRKLEEPLAVIIQSSSAAGKTSLMEAVLSFVPTEERVKYSAMTGQSLFYLGETDLKHKILAIVEEEGASRASYALKLLQSEGELTIASTGKDPATGRLVTQEYRVEGPVMIFLTTTAIEVDEELLNRCIVLSVNEDREQTRAIHRLQREKQTLAGLLARQDRDEVLQVHRNAQRLLRPLLVANPYAQELTFVDDRTRTRRDHVKYLTLIRTIALLHQHQRPLQQVEHRGKRVEYIEATLSDIATANRLAHQVLGRSLDDLPPQTRRLLFHIEELVKAGCAREKVEREDYRFTRRQVRELTGWGNTQLKVHLTRLEELEYLLSHRGARGQSFVYELVYDGRGKDGTPFLPGLIDVERLANRKWAGLREEKSGPGRPLVGPKSAGCRGGENGEKASGSEGMSGSEAIEPENAHPGSVNSGRLSQSYPDLRPVVGARA